MNTVKNQKPPVIPNIHLSSRTLGDGPILVSRFVIAYGIIDDQLYFTFKNEGIGYEVWPYDKRFHILLNLAIGGNWGGQKGIDDSLFPHVFEIDYVRVYKK